MYEMKEEPLWAVEAINALTRQENEDYGRLCSHPEKYGMNLAELQEMFRPYLDYKQAVLPELLAILERNEVIRSYLCTESKNKYDILLNAVSILQNSKQPDQLRCLSGRGGRRKKEIYVSGIIREVLSDGAGYFGEEEDAILFSGAADLSQVLEKSGMPAGEKFRLMNLYLNQDVFLKEFGGMVREMTGVLKKNFPIIKDAYEASVRRTDEAMLGRLLKEGDAGLQFQMEEDKNYCIWISPFLYNGISIHGFEVLEFEYNGSFQIGMFMPQLIGGSMRKDRLTVFELTAVCKALGDSNRFRIFRSILEKGKTYLQELSNEIGLTPATVSHHINSLMGANLIQMVVGGKEKRIVYYEVNQERLDQLGNTFLDLAGEVSKK